MGATSLIMIAWPNWMRERPFSSTVSNRSVISNGVPLALPAGSNAANSSRSGAFVTNAISIYTPLSCVGKLLQMGRDHCTIAKKTLEASERKEEERMLWRENVKKLERSNFIFRGRLRIEHCPHAFVCKSPQRKTSKRSNS